ncbi:Cytochrome c4 precursor [Roseimaritima multifibrata]|uniref:Cytochrome c4 n=1 Tax=Roseimaritima multifibrata TaxID=1930274 RepID=A0A517MD76_9BACT|nr:c-type cytochrome [Roseimaritima multifibrata]QDS92840.1 Cytochrome c4 precursor [Roseimaritima multifibrata]
MKRRLGELTILLASLGILGVMVLVSGIVPIKASSGHWPMTRLILDFASDRSVGLHSAGIEVPPLDEPGMVQLGAAIFDNNCRWCHGAPGFPSPPVAAQMTPHPPKLAEAVETWDDAELFYILKHGIKFTGMPAWPTQSHGEEIWPVVAFLRELPDTDADTYLDLIQSEVAKTDAIETPIAYEVATLCAACHGMADSRPTSDRVPVLASQNGAYLKNSLLAYEAGERGSGAMMPIAHRLTDDQISELSSYYAEQIREPAVMKDSSDEELIEAGRLLAANGDRSGKIPSCVDCHGPGEIMRSRDYPRLAGQPARYLQQQLVLFAEVKRGGSDNASLMDSIADKLSDAQRLALSAYYASLNVDRKE